MSTGWTEFDARRAMKEGWLLSEDNEGGLEIQRHDEGRAFENDDHALYHVYQMARRGSSLHRKAIMQTAFCSPSTPEEYMVSWEIELTATSPEAAAEQAEAIMLDSSRMGNIFVVSQGGAKVLVEMKKGIGHITESEER